MPGLSTEEVQGLFGVSIDSDDFDTVGGPLSITTWDEYRTSGDVVKKDGLCLEVVSVMGRRLRSLRIKKEGGDSPADSG